VVGETREVISTPFTTSCPSTSSFNDTPRKSNTEAMKTITSILATLVLTFTAHADCVFGARTYLSFRVVDSDTIILTQGIGPDIHIQLWSVLLTRASSVRVLKDSFCSFDERVLLIDGEVVDVREVREIKPRK